MSAAKPIAPMESAIALHRLHRIVAFAATGPGSPSFEADVPVPLLAGRSLVKGGPTAYVCRQFTCQAPVTTPAELRETLGA